MCRTERAVSRETSCGGEHLEIWDLFEGRHKWVPRSRPPNRDNGAQTPDSVTPESALSLPCAHRSPPSSTCQLVCSVPSPPVHAASTLECRTSGTHFGTHPTPQA